MSGIRLQTQNAETYYQRPISVAHRYISSTVVSDHFWDVLFHIVTVKFSLTVDGVGHGLLNPQWCGVDGQVFWEVARADKL